MSLFELPRPIQIQLAHRDSFVRHSGRVRHRGQVQHHNRVALEGLSDLVVIETIVLDTGLEGADEVQVKLCVGMLAEVTVRFQLAFVDFDDDVIASSVLDKHRVGDSSHETTLSIH